MKKNERKQTRRDAEQNRNTRSSDTENDSRNEQLKRPFDWDARDLKENTWIPGSTGEYENRFFE